MKAFEYVAPASAEEALKALAGSDNATALAGGTDLIDRMKEYVATPDRVVYIRELTELAGIEDHGDGLTLGANTRLTDLVGHERIRSSYPALAVAARAVGTPQIRNMATLGGNLLQRPRCWYYRNGFGLLGGKRSDSGQLVRELEGEYTPTDFAQGESGHLVRLGDNRYHAIFMTDQDALFVNPSNLAPALIALGATATIVEADGSTRVVKVEELYQVPTSDADRELTVGPGELLTAVTVPAAKGKNATYEVRWKQSHDWPLVVASVCCEMTGDRVASARVVLGQVAPIPYRSEPAERTITGQVISEQTAAAAAEAAVAEARPLSKNGYKVAIARTAIKRALLTAAGVKNWEEA